MHPAVRPSAHDLPTAQRRRRQRLRKKTEAMLRIRIIMADRIYRREHNLATARRASASPG
jgi:hypothetical protein